MIYNIAIMTLQMCLALSVLIFIHELGHYISAKIFGMKVDKFVIFFDIFGWYLFKYQYNNTEYKLGWLPFGGYVKIAGMIDESLSPNVSIDTHNYNAKPRWQRLIVILSGVFFNLLFGLLIFWILTYYEGYNYIPVNSFMNNGIKSLTLGKKAGFCDGDIITKVNEERINKYEDLINADIFLKESYFTILRNNKEISIKIPDNFFNNILEDGIDNFIQPRFKFKIDNVIENTPAYLAGIYPDDYIVAVNNVKINFFDEFQNELQKIKNKDINFTINRNGTLLNKKLILNDDYKLGFLVKNIDITYVHEKYNLYESFKISFKKLYSIIKIQIKSLLKILFGELNISKTLSGPLGIAQQFGNTYITYKFLSLLGLLSIMLSVINILPIPALDGGHAFFLLVEIITRKNINLLFMRNAQIVGMILLLLITIFSFINDIYKTFFLNIQ